MRSPLSLLLTLFLIGGDLPSARSADAPAPTPGIVRELRIDPGTTGVPLGHARLSVDPLSHVSGKEGMSAGYKVDISPFAFKSEAGRFTVAITEADLHRLAGGETLRFTGQAVSQDGSNTSTVEGRATPAADNLDGGELRLQIEGKKGTLVFHTTYHLTR